MAAPLQERNPSMPMAALAYAKLQRWNVLPIHRPVFGADGVVRCSCRNFRNCTNVGKHPRSEHGVKDASRDEEWIRAAWSDEQSNIGVACGVPSGFWALDVDPLKGGDDSLAELEERHGKLPDTVEAITGSGGRHLLFLLPSGATMRNRVGFAPGLDTRSDGGYIIVAPSLHESGKRYVWEASSRPGEVPIVAAPDWLLELVVGSPGEELRDVRGLSETELPELNLRMGRARKYLAKVPGAISGHGGHLRTWLAALILVRGFALPETTALELLSAEYNPRCEPRWSLEELAHKVTSASKDGRRPLGYLLRAHVADPDSYQDAERAAIQDEESTPAPTWKTPAARALLLGKKGVRIPLGIETLDKACRGGLLTGKVVIIGGAPGAGKTTLAAQKALELAQRGVHVAILAADEEADGLLIRIGQNLNLSREDLEGGIKEAKEQLSRWVKPLPLMLFDSDEDEVTIELAAAELAKAAQGAPATLVIDSIQTARSAGSAAADNPRARADEIMRVIKQVAKQYGHLVIALSEVSRGWYRNSNDRIDPLAAFKESGGIEYGAAVALAMANVKGEDDLVDVVIAKNRLGQKPPFRVMLSFARARFAEVPIEVEEPEDEDERESARIEKARGRVLFALAKVSSLKTKTAVCTRARGNRKDNMKAFDELVVEGLIVQVGGVFRAFHRPEKEVGNG